MLKTLVRVFLCAVCQLLFRVRIQGLASHFKQERLLIIANHESWIDGLILGLFLPVNPVFVVYSGITRRPLFRMILSLVDYVKVNTSSPLAMKSVVSLIKSGRPVMIFPEGRLTVTGTLMKVYNGPAFAAVRSEATIVPVRLDGPGRSYLTRLGGKHPRQFLPKITIRIHDPITLAIPEGGTAKARRVKAGEDMRRVMQETFFDSQMKRSLYASFVEACYTYGMKRPIMTDIKQIEYEMLDTLPEGEKPVKEDYRYRDILKMVIGTGRLISFFTKKGETVGILMPNLAVTVGMVLGTSAHGRVPAMLNYKAGPGGLADACVAADIKTIITSHKFVKLGALEDSLAALKDSVNIIYLEDVRHLLSFADKIAIAFYMMFPRLLETEVNIEDPGVVLFTSGSEGKPKGVVLSHRAITSNIAQVRAVFDFCAEDSVFNPLPIFHSFGLTGGALLPLFSGLHLLLFPSPLRYKEIPELSYQRNCTVLFGTSTFLANYAKHADPYDFFRLRYVIAGAEKVSDAVRDIWFEKFGKRIFEGYGATETAPVLAVNTQMAYKTGTVGQFLPGIEYRLVPVPGINEGGALYVRGPNIMSGYYRYENPGVLEPTTSDEFGEGWYATGDVVKIENGFISIVDRVKRFAKIGGEMVSLSVVEKMAEMAAPSYLHGVTTQPDAHKGEVLVLFTTDGSLTREMLLEQARALGVPELSVPRKIVFVAAIPLLGTGKTDHVTLKKMAMAA